MERTERISGLIEDLPVAELRRITLQAIDHAYKSAAEVAEATAKFQGALGNIAQLEDENRRLRELLGKQPWRAPLARGRESVRGVAARPVRWVRRQAGR